MRKRSPIVSALPVAPLLLLLATGCGSGAGARQASAPAGALIVEGAEMRAFGVRLLDGLGGRVSTMYVSRAAGGCPQVVLRGQRTLVGSTRPEIYVDGTRMSDTCILDQLRVADVKRVEIYRGSVSGRAGYAASPNGLIVVHLVDGTN